MQRAPGGERTRRQAPRQQSSRGDRLTGRDILIALGIGCTLIAADAGVNLMTRSQDRDAATAKVTVCDDLAVQILDNGARAFKVGDTRYQLVFGAPNQASVCTGSKPDVDSGDAALAYYQRCDAIGGLSGPDTATVVSPRNNRYRVQVRDGNATVCLLGD
jgi:hypothetical protein